MHPCFIKVYETQGTFLKTVPSVIILGEFQHYSLEAGEGGAGFRVSHSIGNLWLGKKGFPCDLA